MFTYGNGTWSLRANGTLKKHRGNLNLRDVNYIGFEFLQAGKIHDGWARLQVTFVRRQYYQTKAHIHILSYGYETAPNTAISAGSCAAESAEDPIGNGPSRTKNDSMIGETGTGSIPPQGRAWDTGGWKCGASLVEKGF